MGEFSYNCDDHTFNYLIDEGFRRRVDAGVSRGPPHCRALSRGASVRCHHAEEAIGRYCAPGARRLRSSYALQVTVTTSTDSSSPPLVQCMRSSSRSKAALG